jgi:hypothetical protein
MDRKPKTLTIIVTEDDESMLGQIAEVYPLVRHHRIAQVALRCGLRVIRGDPDRLVREALDVPADPVEPRTAGGAR